MSNNIERLKNVLSAVFEIPIDVIDENTSIDNVENWDSIHHLNLILALEEEFEISIPDEEVGNLVNFKLIEIIVNENQ